MFQRSKAATPAGPCPPTPRVHADRCLGGQHQPVDAVQEGVDDVVGSATVGRRLVTIDSSRLVATKTGRFQRLAWRTTTFW